MIEAYIIGGILSYFAIGSLVIGLIKRLCAWRDQDLQDPTVLGLLVFVWPAIVVFYMFGGIILLFGLLAREIAIIGKKK